MGTVLASDISGSSLTIAFQNYERDAATRKFLVEATSRADAINTIIGDANALNNTVDHPDESALKADGITAQAVGPGRWVVTVQYLRRPGYGTIPSTVTTLANLRMSYEGIEVFCTPRNMADGLPFGDGNGTEFVYPGGPAGLSTDPQDPPKPWVFNRPVVNIQIPFSTGTFPSTAMQNVGGYNQTNTFNVGGFVCPIGTVRYDGAELRATGPSVGGFTPPSSSVRYYGTYSYTYSPGGFYKQRITYNSSSSRWQAQNVIFG
jgi:hypothetical protein